MKATGRCWAGSLGGCDSISGEHVISRSIFAAGCSCPRVIEGVKRIRQGERTPNAETANILCRRHNSMLSPLDEVAGTIAKFQASTNDENFEEPLFVEGERFERWLLKTVVNVAVAGWAGARKWLPTPNVVSAIFCGTPVPYGVGFYSVDGVDPHRSASGGVSFTPILFNKEADPQLGGAYISIHWLTLFVSLNTDLAQRLEAGAVPSLQERFSNDGLKHHYRPAAVVMSRKRGVRSS